MKIKSEKDMFDESFLNNFMSSLFCIEKYKTMKSDLIEEKNEYILIIDLPGYPKENISIKIKDEYLVVEAKKDDDKEKKYLYRERLQQKCMRKYYLGELNEKNIKARYDNGTLFINILKDNINDSKEKEVKLE